MYQKSVRALLLMLQTYIKWNQSLVKFNKRMNTPCSVIVYTIPNGKIFEFYNKALLLVLLVYADTHNFPVSVVFATAVGGGQCRGALLQVPGFAAPLRHAGDGQGEETVGVAITITRVVLTAAITRCPHEDRTLSLTTLWNNNGF